MTRLGDGSQRNLVDDFRDEWITVSHSRYYIDTELPEVNLADFIAHSAFTRTDPLCGPKAHLLEDWQFCDMFKTNI